MTMRIIHGTIALVGKSPDGDSVRFIADNPSFFDDLYRRHRMKFSGQDGSIQLRLEGIDTPETHYGRNAQPYGDTARDKLLELLGFNLALVQFAESGVVNQDDNNPIRAAIATSGADANGRPISLMFTATSAPAADGTDLFVTPAHAATSVNFALVDQGHAYPALYTSMPLPLRRGFRDAARNARSAARGLWPLDATDDFRLQANSDIEPPNGALIMPKLFRRATDYLRDVTRGFQGNLSDWLVARSSGSRPENDLILLGDGGSQPIEVPFSSLIEQRNSRVGFTADICDIAIVEK